MSDPGDLALFLDEAWAHLQAGVSDSTAPARYLTLATVSPSGVPEARTVALRVGQKAAGILEVHTDIKTPKVAALQANPIAAFHVWIAKARLQIRATGRIEILMGEAVSADWARVPEASRVSYGTEPVPGAPIDTVYAYEKPANAARFAVLRCHLSEIDLVHLDTRHRRARYTRNTGWTGVWVAP